MSERGTESQGWRGRGVEKGGGAKLCRLEVGRRMEIERGEGAGQVVDYEQLVKEGGMWVSGDGKGEMPNAVGARNCRPGGYANRSENAASGPGPTVYRAKCKAKVGRRVQQATCLLYKACTAIWTAGRLKYVPG